ncbi:MAG: glycosyltransferase [Chryseobacterium sp.]|nr:MAG: glycosyltransferase [Chryseobacterium sp.]
MRTIKLSLILPVYNAEKTLRKTVESVLTQKNHHLDFELLIVNDGSTDNSWQIIRDFCNAESRIKSFSRENVGVYKTRNFALARATGDYIWMIDADDHIAQNAFQFIGRKLAGVLPDVLSLGYGEGSPTKEGYRLHSVPSERPLSGLEYLSSNDGRLYLWSHIYRRAFLEANDIRFPGCSYSLEDFYFNMRVFTSNPVVELIAEPVYYYEFNEGSISKKATLENRMRQLESSINLHCSLLELYNQQTDDLAMKKVVKAKMNHSVLGLFFSLLKENYPLHITIDTYRRYRALGLIPLEQLDKRQRIYAFNACVNRRWPLLMFSYLNNLLRPGRVPR